MSSQARAVGPPQVAATWASEISLTSGRLQAEISPNGLTTGYHFDYLTQSAYQANLGAGKDGFSGAARLPLAADVGIGSGAIAISVVQLMSGLQGDTAYRYRVVASNSAGTTPGAPLFFVTRQPAGASVLADGRGWEMVSPIDKNGGQADPPGSLFGGGVLQAAAGGGAITYSSAASFGGGAVGAPPASQYVAVRGGSEWASQNISTPLFSGSYGAPPDGVPYQLFSADLARGILLNGHRCRGEGLGCAVANPPLPGTDAPQGYQNLYLREGGGFTALLGAASAGVLALDPAGFELSFSGAAPDLRHVVVSTCAALTANATEVPLGQGCDSAKPNLYEYSPGTGLTLVNLLPAQGQGAPGAALAAQSGAVSVTGDRVYWRELQTGNLYLRQGGQTVQVDIAVGGGGEFQAASTDGSVAFYTKGGHLYRYDAVSPGSTDLTPAGGVLGVLGGGETGGSVYYATGAGLFVWRGGVTTQVSPAAVDAGNYPPATGTSRVSADGNRLLFVSTPPLTGYDNTNTSTGSPEPQVYLYEATAPSLTCVSCSPTNGRPRGPSGIPGSVPNGTGPQAADSYKPRVLSADGRRVFFDSRDSLAPTDTNAAWDAYQWEAQGSGSCARAGGCVSLISGGRSAGASSFVDASADGSDAFFLTEASLVGADPGSVDLYDARVGGGFPVPPAPIACQGDACQFLPSEPVDPALSTLLTGRGNPAVKYIRYKRHRKPHPKKGKKSGKGGKGKGRRGAHGGVR